MENLTEQVAALKVFISPGGHGPIEYYKLYDDKYEDDGYVHIHSLDLAQRFKDSVVIDRWQVFHNGKVTKEGHSHIEDFKTIAIAYQWIKTELRKDGLNAVEMHTYCNRTEIIIWQRGTIIFNGEFDSDIQALIAAYNELIGGK